MNCRNCGAPAIVIDDHASLRCEYCHAYQSPSGTKEETVDGARSLGRSLEEYLCPRCMTELDVAMVDGHQVALCSACHGILLPRPDFAGLVAHRRANWQGTSDSVQPMNAEELHQSAKCPACWQRMDTYPYAGPGAVVIDCCIQCDLIWMDAGELRRLERAPGARTL